MSSLTSDSRYSLATISARMVARVSPPQAEMAWSTAASSPSFGSVSGWEAEDKALIPVGGDGTYVPYLF